MSNPPISTPELDVTGRVFVITGGTQGLGKAVARQLQEKGASGLVLVSRSERTGKLSCEELTTSKCKCVWIKADLGSADEASNVIPEATELMKDIGTISGLVNAAAITTRGNLENTTYLDFDTKMAVNVRAPFLITQAAARIMPRGSSIVNIASVAAYGGAPFIMAYSVSKAALVALTKNNAAELASKGIRVNAINLGWTFTETENKIQCKEHVKKENWLDSADASVPLGRILRPEDAASTVLFLLSSASNMMSGSIIDLHPDYAHGMISTSAIPGAL